MADLNAFSDGAQAARGGATSAQGAELTSDFAYDRFTHPKKRTEVLFRALTLSHPLFKHLGVFFSLWQWLRTLPSSAFSHFLKRD